MKSISINIDNTDLKCEHLCKWYDIEILITDEINHISNCVKDKDIIFIVPRLMIDILDRTQLETLFWHEVSHIYFKDNKENTDISKEYRADLLAMKATSQNNLMKCLEILRDYMSDTTNIDKRIHNIISQSINIEENPIDLLYSIGGIKV